ncbi:MAG: hypothetical protein PHE49_07340 [bacterium]|nr:hypothetical protein [bacterium]
MQYTKCFLGVIFLIFLCLGCRKNNVTYIKARHTSAILEVTYELWGPDSHSWTLDGLVSTDSFYIYIPLVGGPNAQGPQSISAKLVDINGNSIIEEHNSADGFIWGTRDNPEGMGGMRPYAIEVSNENSGSCIYFDVGFYRVYWQ